ncbi:hypothetical protein [Streptomyces sp. NPDC047000]|uniref:hypothetical protein n=1 Tax=Streptomyces sp. NPDC047000 TaxID=3155474 RepID=UPI00340729ED
MAPNTNGPETRALRSLVSELPDRVETWTSEQRQQFAAQSDRSMHEQAGTSQPD